MMLILEHVLAVEDLDRVRAGLADAAWVDGKATAGAAARAVKNNEQARGLDALGDFVAAALQRHPLFTLAARPRRLSRFMFSRYAPGMAYGAHIDDAVMGAPPLRTDLAFTVFLADAESYDGGALIVESALGEQEIKLAAGDAVLYPAGTIHRVAPVTNGVRLACVGWIESLVAAAARREVLFDLAVARMRLVESGGDVLLLDKSIANLLRMWAQP